MNELKELPEGWKWVILKDISESIQYGYTESSSKEPIGPKFLRITDIQENKVFWESVPFCKIDEVSINRYLLKDGDLVFARTGATVGKSFLIKGLIPKAVFASYLIRVRVNKEINEKFLSNFFYSSNYWSQITKGQVGIGQPNVNGTTLGKLIIPLPPLPTQQTIVSKIEELFSELDKGVENLKTAQQQLKVYRQAVLKWAFEGKLTNGINNDANDLSDEKDLGMVAEPGAVYQVCNSNKIQIEWKYKRLSDMFNFIGGGTPSKAVKSYWDGSIPWASVKDIKGDYLKSTQDFITERGLENSASNLAEINDVILITRISPGKVIIANIRSAINQDLKILKPKFKTTPKFIKYFFNAIERDCIKIASGTTVLGITLNNLNELLMPNLSLDEQSQIVQEIEKRLSVADKMEESIQQSLLKAESLRQSILKKAFEGGLVK